MFFNVNVGCGEQLANVQYPARGGGFIENSKCNKIPRKKQIWPARSIRVHFKIYYPIEFQSKLLREVIIILTQLLH